MSAVVQKHSRSPRKQTAPVAPLEMPERELSVAKRPLGNLPAELRAEIADKVLERYMAGEQVANIAPEFKTSDVTIYALLLREREADWVDIQKARALARYERYQDELEAARERMKAAPDALSLARERDQARVAESLVKSAQWELERLLRRLYGQDQQITLAIVDLGDRLRRARERVIDVGSAPTQELSSDTSV